MRARSGPLVCNLPLRPCLPLWSSPPPGDRAVSQHLGPPPPPTQLNQPPSGSRQGGGPFLRRFDPSKTCLEARRRLTARAAAVRGPAPTCAGTPNLQRAPNLRGSTYLRGGGTYPARGHQTCTGHLPARGQLTCEGHLPAREDPPARGTKPARCTYLRGGT